MRKAFHLKQACRERLECGRSTSGTVEFSENALDMEPSALGLMWHRISSACGDFVAQQLGKATRAIDNQPGDVVLVGYFWCGMAITETGPTHATALSNDLEWAFILTVVH